MSTRQNKLLLIAIIAVLSGAWLAGRWHRTVIPVSVTKSFPEAPVAITPVENFSKVKRTYVKSGALYVDVQPGTAFEIQSNLADQAGKFYLSTHKNAEFIQVYVTENGSFCLAAVYDGVAAGAKR